jgi:hypothetical protein
MSKDNKRVRGLQRPKVGSLTSISLIKPCGPIFGFRVLCIALLLGAIRCFCLPLEWLGKTPIQAKQSSLIYGKDLQYLIRLDYVKLVLHDVPVREADVSFDIAETA